MRGKPGKYADIVEGTVLETNLVCRSCGRCMYQTDTRPRLDTGPWRTAHTFLVRLLKVPTAEILCHILAGSRIAW